MSLRDELQQSYQDASVLLSSFISEAENMDKTAAISEALADTFQKGGKVLICGNGGSTCDAMHFAEEFTGRYRKNRRPLPAISLTDPSHITCVANDFGFEEVFSRGVEAFGKEHDMLIGISTSGNSENVIRAMAAGSHQGLVTVGLLGKEGGKLAGQCDYEFIISERTADRIQEMHMMILHIIIEGVERILFPEQY